MKSDSTQTAQHTLTLFNTRLDTLQQLTEKAQSHFKDSEFLGLRLAEDMFPLATQVVFTCNQPHNYVQWMSGKEAANLDADIQQASDAVNLVKRVKAEIVLAADNDLREPSNQRVELGPSQHLALSGREYVNDFLIPNFYFHLVATYSILRANGVELGKADYMAHVAGNVRSTNTS